VNLQGRAALVTGGARMGEAVAAMLADGGADVAFTYRMSADAA
jgi:3-oxoacyl-[acyl-carrier protein] reductase